MRCGIVAQAALSEHQTLTLVDRGRRSAHRASWGACCREGLRGRCEMGLVGGWERGGVRWEELGLGGGSRSGSRSRRWRVPHYESGSSTNTRITGGGRLRSGLPATTSSARAPARQHRSPSCKLCTSDLGRARNTTLPIPIPTTNRLTSELTCDHIYPPARSVGDAGEGAHPRPSCEPKATWDVGAGTPLLEFCVPMAGV